jgi:hypothetical protein
VATFLRQPRTFAVIAWIAGFAAYVALEGLPTRRTSVLVWIALAVLALGAGRPRATLRSFATTWLPVFAALCAYDLLRGVSDDAGVRAHTHPQFTIDQWLGRGRTVTEVLQSALWHPGNPHWWDYGIWAVYQSHFLVPLLLAVLLSSVRDRQASQYIVGLVLLSWAALATYWLYPAQPPWMVARDGLTGDVTRIVHQMWADVGVDRAARVWTPSHTGESRYANPIAALPSLHAAFPMLIAVTLRGRRRALDLLLAAYVLAMGFTLVYAGEHFVFDVVLGWAYAIAVAMLAMRFGSASASAAVASPVPQAAASGVGGSAVALETASRRR